MCTLPCKGNCTSKLSLFRAPPPKLSTLSVMIIIIMMTILKQIVRETQNDIKILEDQVVLELKTMQNIVLINNSRTTLPIIILMNF